MAFPTTGILDTFNRANEGPPPSSKWDIAGYLNSPGTVQVSSNTGVDLSNFGQVWGTSYLNQEAYYSFSTLMADTTSSSILCCWDVSNPYSQSGYEFLFRRQVSNSTVQGVIYRVTAGASSTIGSIYANGVLAIGDKIGASVINGALRAYVCFGGKWVQAGSATDTTYSGGRLGVIFGLVAAIYDFGGGEFVDPTGTYPTARMRSRRTSW